MKKVTSGILVCIMVIAMCMCLTACSPSGTYNFESMTMKIGPTSTEIKADTPIDLGMGTSVTIKKEDISLVINKDKTFELKMDTTAMGGQSEVENGTWEKKDGKLLLTDGEKTDTIEAEVDGSTITLTVEEGTMKMTIVFKK